MLAIRHRSLRCLTPFKSIHRGLKIAFFGSDDFSIPSLKALARISKEKPSLVESIHVIAKHPKHTGRELITLTDVPIATVAKQEGISLIRAESKAEILELIPNKYELAIAVSYGKLIPQKFIQEVPYSLNIHPSLLPKYSGASPLQYALLNQDEYTGVTVQTLHPTEFDKGQIVAQSDKIPIRKHETLADLTARLAQVGADMLVKVLDDESYKNPNFHSDYKYSYAKKITPEMKEINWNEYSADQLLARFNTLGPLYSYKEIKVKQRRKPLIHDFRRVIFYDVAISESIAGLQPGEFTLKNDTLLIQTKDGSIMTKSLQFEFQKRENAVDFIKHLPKRAGDTPFTFTAKSNIK